MMHYYAVPGDGLYCLEVASQVGAGSSQHAMKATLENTVPRILGPLEEMQDHAMVTMKDT